MFINGAIIRRGKHQFVIIETKSCTVKSNFEAAKTRKSLNSTFKGLPIVLMAKDTTGEKKFNGRPELINACSEIDDSEVDWKKYAVKK